MHKLNYDPFSFAKQFNTTVGFEPILKKIAEVGAYKVEADGQAYYASDGFPIQLIAIETASAK